MSRIDIIWDTAKRRPVTDIWRPVPVSPNELFSGVSAGDTVQVSVSLCTVVGGRVRSVVVPDTSATLSFYRGGFPSDPVTVAFSDGSDATVERPVGDFNADIVSRLINSLPGIQATGGVWVHQLGVGLYEIISRKQNAIYTLSATGDAEIFPIRPGAVGKQRIDHLLVRSQSEITATLTGAMDAPGVTVTEVEAGTATTEQVEDVELTGDFEGGAFRLSNGTFTTSPLPFDAAAGQVEEELNGELDPVSVKVEALGRGRWRITYVDLGVQPGMSGSATGLAALQGVTGEVDLTVSADGGDFSLICSVGDPVKQTLFSAPVRLGPAIANA